MVDAWYAVTAQRRASMLPDVSAMAEAGLPDFEITSWFGLLVPAGQDRQSRRDQDEACVKAGIDKIADQLK